MGNHTRLFFCYAGASSIEFCRVGLRASVVAMGRWPMRGCASQRQIKQKLLEGSADQSISS